MLINSVLERNNKKHSVQSLGKFGKINRNDRYFYIFTVFWLSRGYAA